MGLFCDHHKAHLRVRLMMICYSLKKGDHMANKTNKDGWEDIPEFDSEEAQRERDKQDREIEADIKEKEQP